MKRISLSLLAAACLANAQAAEIKIVATTTDLADIARAVEGDLAEVSSITTGREDPHTLTAKPGFIVRARDADVWIRVGMELEIGWEPVILREARNPRIRVGTARHIDASDHVLRLEVPTQRVTRDQGDIHPEGNPHYWLDPLNGRLVAATIAERLASLYPERKAAEFVASRTGAKVVVVPTMTGGSPEAASYLEMLDNVIRKLNVGLRMTERM